MTTLQSVLVQIFGKLNYYRSLFDLVLNGLC